MGEEIEAREIQPISQSSREAGEYLGMVVSEGLPMIAQQMLTIARYLKPVTMHGTFNEEHVDVLFRLNTALMKYTEVMTKLARANKDRPKQYSTLDPKKLDERFQQIEEALAQRQKDIADAAEARKTAGSNGVSREQMRSHLARSRRHSQTGADDDE